MIRCLIIEDMPEHLPSREIIPDQKGVLMSDASPIRDSDRIPTDYTLFRRQVHLLNGKIEPAFYSTREDQVPDPYAWECSSSSIIEGFMWALTVPEFADHEAEDDDRTQEIGNMMSFAMSQGLTEEQVLECYRQAFAIASKK